MGGAHSRVVVLRRLVRAPSSPTKRANGVEFFSSSGLGDRSSETFPSRWRGSSRLGHGARERSFVSLRRRGGTRGTALGVFRNTGPGKRPLPGLPAPVCSRLLLAGGGDRTVPLMCQLDLPERRAGPC